MTKEEAITLAHEWQGSEIILDENKALDNLMLYPTGFFACRNQMDPYGLALQELLDRIILTPDWVGIPADCLL